MDAQNIVATTQRLGAQFLKNVSILISVAQKAKLNALLMAYVTITAAVKMSANMTQTTVLHPTNAALPELSQEQIHLPQVKLSTSSSGADGVEYCCPLSDNMIYAGENAADNGLADGPFPSGGCCHLAHGDAPNTCCAEGTEWDADTETCIPPCPCEGCCDFNCCDELDYFLHTAYDDHYSQTGEFADFEEFYAHWYTDFYHWWVTGPSA